MKFATETLMAYADGEVDAATRSAIEAAMATDPEIAAEVARHRALQLKVRAAFGDVIHETVPDRLIATARTAPAGTAANASATDAARTTSAGAATVANLADARAAKQKPGKRSWSWPEWSAIAASLLLGVLGGRAALMNDTDNAIVASNGRMIAAGTLAAALDTQPSGAAVDGTSVQIGASFRAHGGEYCRTFTVNENGALAGLACREADSWNVRALTQSGKSGETGGYRMAGTTLPPAIAEAVKENIEGEALDAEEEAATRERGWRK